MPETEEFWPPHDFGLDGPSITVTPVLWCWVHHDATIYRSPKNERDWYCRTWSSYNGNCDISARRMEVR